MTTPPLTYCAALPPEPAPVRRYVGDAWPFLYFYYTLGSDGVTKTPVVINNTITGLLLRGSQMLATLSPTSDYTNLAGGQFKLLVPASVTLLVPPDPERPTALITRLVVVQTDGAGNPTTLVRQPIVVSSR